MGVAFWKRSQNLLKRIQYGQIIGASRFWSGVEQ